MVLALAMVLVKVTLKLGSSPNAAANSFRVSSVPGALSTKLAILASTYPFIARFAAVTVAMLPA